MIDTSFLNQIKRFDLVIKKRVISQYAGERSSDHIGEGLVFQDYREYVPGDDFRAIDWKVYARTSKFYIRRYEEERNLTVHVLIDSSASMDFGTTRTKFEYAAMIAIGISYLALKNNEKFEISTFSDKMHSLRARKGKNQLASLVEYFNKIKPTGQSKFRESLDMLKQRLKSKSMIIIVSDFLFDPAELEATLHQFKRSEIKVIQVLDSQEVKLSLSGENILKDSESGGLLRTFVSNRLRTQYKNNLAEHMARLKNICDNVGAVYVPVNTGDEIFEAFYQVLKQ